MKKLVRALQRLSIRAHKRYVPFTTSYPGFPCSVIDKSSFLSMHDEVFDREIYRFSTDSPSPYIIDCGANIGLSAIYFKKAFPAADIVSFEPDPVAFSALKKNLASAQVQGIHAVNKGLGAREETRRFFSEGADGGRVAVATDADHIISIDVVPLSRYIDRPVDMLKIDIEGSELEVLEECAHTLGSVQNIFVEYHSLGDKPQGLDRILSILSKAGFRYYVEGTGVHSTHPLVSISRHLGYDNQLNIFGYRP